MSSPWQKAKWEEYKAGETQRQFKSDLHPSGLARRTSIQLKDWLRGNPVPELWNPPVEVLAHEAALANCLCAPRTTYGRLWGSSGKCPSSTCGSGISAGRRR